MGNRLRMPQHYLLVGLVVILLAFALTPAGGAPAGAQDNRYLEWERFDVIIDNVDTAANRFDVTESYVLNVRTGPYRFGTATIPMERTEGIRNLRITENGQPLRDTCSGSAGTFCAVRLDDTFDITYYFSQPLQSGQRTTIDLTYTVDGALRSYEDGDQLWWVAIPADLPFPVRASRIEVHLPEGVPVDVATSYPDTWAQSISGSTVIWEAPDTIPSGGYVEVRVQYPHNPAMEKPGWQAGFDRQRNYDENIKPIVGVVLALVAVLIGAGGILWVYSRYMTHGRDPEAVVVPEYLAEPPSNERPGVVGVLLDERADMKDIMATLIDLAQRGYIVIEQTSEGGILGLFEKTEFRFHRTDESPDALRSHERELLRALFRGDRETSLSELRNKFYEHIPGLNKELYAEVERQGYFTRSPDSTRNRWAIGGVIVMVLAGLLFAGSWALTSLSPLIVCPPIALGVVGLAMSATSFAMPAKTEKGAQEAARWKAFRRYLMDIDRYTGVEAAAQKFDEYMAYAVAFGIENQFVRQVTPAMTSMPRWYFPTYMGGPWGRGYRRGQPYPTMGGPGGLGDISLGGPGGLNEMSRSMTEGLNAMSSGLTKMLNDASSAMTSRPQSSSGSGGGFSGGGFSGGGGSGGGSRGFG